MEKSINEILVIINEQFLLNLISVVGIDDEDLLLGGDEYGISWNIMTQNIRIYYNGLQIVFLSKLNIKNEYSEVDLFQYNKLLKNLISITDDETLDEIQRALQKYIVFERFEDAQKLKNFLDLFN
tara:strand:- start:1086 stop:1460 length:375 start_codon:yes stop_codon:yes gene_type:complete